MNASIINELKRELSSRGFSADGYSPHRTVGFDDTFLATIEIADLLDTMVSRRQKIFRSQAVVGEDAARKSWEDVILIIDALKAVIGRLSLT